MNVRWPPITARSALLFACAGVVLGLWQGTAALLALRAGGDTTPWPEPYVWELTGGLAGAATIWIPMTAVLNARRPFRLRGVAIHVAAFIVFAATKDALMLGARFALYPVLGWGDYDYPSWRVHLAMELTKDAFTYTLISIGYGFYRGWRERQVLALRESALATELKEARLQALLGQLNPHFLFNALNTVSSTMYEDLDRTDRLLANLGDVLRAGLDSERATWTLGEERAHTERFFALIQARFGERVRLTWDVDDNLQAVAVPRFALQLLVENAIKHNQDRASALAIAIRAREDDGRIVLEVEDDGRGLASPSPAAGAGVGLRHLEEVLALLYDGAGRLERGASASGGARLRIVIPAEAP